MRSVFETQPDVAHVYLGSKRHMLERIFNDENEPFWRSAKQMELGVIAPPLFRAYIDARFESTGRRSNLRSSIACSMPRSAIPMRPRSSPTSCGKRRPREGSRRATSTTSLLRAPARRARPLRPRLGEGRARRSDSCSMRSRASPDVRSSEYRRRHGLPGPSSVQRALAALVKDELVGRDGSGEYRIAEPFLAEWLRREEQ